LRLPAKNRDGKTLPCRKRGRKRSLTNLNRAEKRGWEGTEKQTVRKIKSRRKERWGWELIQKGEIKHGSSGTPCTKTRGQQEKSFN